MSKIDWTKPLRVRGDSRRVHVVSGNYVDEPGKEPLVALRLSQFPGASNWSSWSSSILYRTKDNQVAHPIESNPQQGSAVVIENVPELRSTFSRIYSGRIPGRRAFGSVKEAFSYNGGTADAVLETIFENDLPVEVKLHKKPDPITSPC